MQCSHVVCNYKLGKIMRENFLNYKSFITAPIGWEISQDVERAASQFSHKIFNIRHENLFLQKSRNKMSDL